MQKKKEAHYVFHKKKTNSKSSPTAAKFGRQKVLRKC